MFAIPEQLEILTKNVDHLGKCLVLLPLVVKVLNAGKDIIVLNAFAYLVLLEILIYNVKVSQLLQ